MNAGGRARPVFRGLAGPGLQLRQVFTHLPRARTDVEQDVGGALDFAFDFPAMRPPTREEATIHEQERPQGIASAQRNIIIIITTDLLTKESYQSLLVP